MKKLKKIFVLDTSVVLHSHDSIMNFEENDIGIPITVLEELDEMKKGNDTKNFEAREFIRLIDKLSKHEMLDKWISLNGKNKGKFKVLVDKKNDINNIFNDEINDHKILNSAVQLQKEEKDKLVILVSKDINLRLKAKSLKLRAEDYLTGKIQNVNSLDFESQVLENIKDSSIDKLYKNSILKKTQVYKKKINNYPVHIKYNTGLNRLGFSTDDIIWIEQEIKASPFMIKSIYSHLGESESQKPNEACENQIISFEKIKKSHENNGNRDIDFHILNTSGIFNYPNLQYDAVRIGIGFHGY